MADGQESRSIDETVRATQDFLEEHPEEVSKLGCSVGQAKAQGIGRKVISEFLNWDYNRVGHSLERLGLIDEGVVEAEAVRSLPTERAARDFVKAVQDTTSLNRRGLYGDFAGKKWLKTA